MRNCKRRITGVFLSMLLAASLPFSAMAASNFEDTKNIGKITIKVTPKGTPAAGKEIGDVSASVSGSRCEVNYCFFTDEGTWSKGDVPTIVIGLDANSPYIFGNSANSYFKITGNYGAKLDGVDIQESGEFCELTVVLNEIGKSSNSSDDNKKNNNNNKDQNADSPLVNHIESIILKAGWRQDGVGWWYQYADGNYPVDSWQNLDGNWYCFGPKGYMLTGWIQRGKQWMYCGPDGAMRTGWQEINGLWYYFSEQDGTMQVNTVTPDGYTLNSDGVRVP